MGSILVTLHDVKRELDIFTERILSNYDLSLEQLMLLSILKRDKRMTTTKAAEELRVSKPAISRRFKELYKKALVNRISLDDCIENDFRIVVYKLTAKGENNLAEITDYSLNKLKDKTNGEAILKNIYCEVKRLNANEQE